MKWEDKLLRFKFMIITDHEALGYLKTQRKLSSRQVRWLDYMSRFDTTIVYVKGTENKVADCLSRYYEDGGGESVSNDDIDWANADICLDPEGDDLPHDRWQELRLSVIRKVGGEPMCQVWVYSGRRFGQVRTKADERREERAGQEVSPARVGDCLDSTTKDNER